MKIAINGEILEVSGGGGGLPEGTVAVKPVTQAEYDALTDDEKQADVVYAITDDAVSGGDSYGDNVYSSEEVRVGTWFGKPLYRKTSPVFDLLAGINILIPISELSDVDVFVSSAAILINDSGANNNFVTLPFVSVTEGGIVGMSAVVSISNEGLQVVLYKMTGYKGRGWIEYTKTTDTGGTT